MNAETLRVSIVQTSIAWEDKARNLDSFEQKVQSCSSCSDVVVLPEMFTTGFSMQGASELAESTTGTTIARVKKWALEGDVLIIGSFIATENNKLYNRAFAVLPNQEIYWYDKKHLFSMSGEDDIFSAGENVCIVPYKGWNIALTTCYDIRFPVWLRNVNNAYDMLVVVANWPASRKEAFNTLLKARAIENLSYVCASNCIGTDGKGISYTGNSQVIDFKGFVVANVAENADTIVSYTVEKESLTRFRTNFPAWKDADSFLLQ
ncbi:MAG: nitrilase family protein [Paludibacteraceae bacterium]|nr:nitrilase family protein [Paludibacteraceae bacterium]